MKSIFLFLLSAFLLFSCGQTSNEIKEDIKISNNEKVNPVLKSEIPSDTIFVIIPCRNCKQANLSNKDIVEIEKLLIKCIDDYCEKLKKFNGVSLTIDIKKYRRQYVPSINDKGEKEVWINCFCSDKEKNMKGEDANWKKDIIGEMVIDGGYCYFNFTVNLTTGKYTDLSAHSQG